MGAAIAFEHVSKQFTKSDVPAVDEVSLTVEQGEFITILGSSGCGKTTLLKMVNRLYEPDQGVIQLFGENTKEIETIALRRNIGYVIQQAGLFPHMTVAENIAVVPKLLKWEKEKTEERVDELLELVGLEKEEYKTRYPHQLSGGQQQRVGLARALAANPQIMLLDEPFGAIDAINRGRLQTQIQKIQGELGKTFLFVTHDMNEAFRLGHRVIVMNKGKVRQFDTPSNIIREPADEFVNALIGSAKEQGSFWEELE